MFHQINIENIPDPFIQEEGTIYWLDVIVDLADPTARMMARMGMEDLPRSFQ